MIRGGILLVALSATACGSIRAADSIETAGTALQLILPTGAAGVAAYRHDGHGAVELIETLGVTAVSTLALKYTLLEKRPNGGEHSFPSGHTSVSFAAAEFLRRRYGWSYGLPAYAAAAFVGYSRVESKQHYAHDVVAGAAIGFVSSAFLTKPLQGVHVEAGANHSGGWISVAAAW